MQDKSEARDVTMDVATDLRVYAGQRWPTMNHKWRKARLASLLGMNERRVKSIYEAEQTARLRADEEVRIKALIGRKEEANAASDRAFAERIAALEAELAGVRALVDRLSLEGDLGASRATGSGSYRVGKGHPFRRATD
jgi:hypothetical protein